MATQRRMEYVHARDQIKELTNLCTQGSMLSQLCRWLGGLNPKQKGLTQNLQSLSEDMRSNEEADDTTRDPLMWQHIYLDDEQSKKLQAIDTAIHSRITMGRCIVAGVVVELAVGGFAAKEFAEKGIMSVSTLAPIGIMAIAFLLLAVTYFSARNHATEAEKTALPKEAIEMDNLKPRDEDEGEGAGDNHSTSLGE